MEEGTEDCIALRQGRTSHTRSQTTELLTSATDFEHHFSGLVASLALYEAGKFDILGIAPKSESLARQGAAAELADAFKRGGACSGDFSAIDHLGRADEPLNAVRASCGIGPRAN